MIQQVVANFRLADLADILIVAGLFYWSIALIRGTRAVQMLIGLGFVGLLYVVSQYFELFTLAWILTQVLSSVLLVVVVLFQNEIRRGLMQVGRGRIFGRDGARTEHAVEEIARAASAFSGRRVGMLVVLEREVGLNEHIESGTLVDAQVSRELLESIFQSSSPLHDGAVVIRNGRILAAGCFLPLTTNPATKRAVGSRHRAALGITEESDALAVVVSEEDGQISLVTAGQMVRDIDATGLRRRLLEALR